MDSRRKNSSRGRRKPHFSRGTSTAAPSASHAKGGHNTAQQVLKSDSAFPSPALLQEYEYAAEGTVERLLKMAEIEQARRNQWESDYMLFHRKSRRMGQLFGFIILIAVIIAVVKLTTSGHADVAKVLAISAFSAAAFSTIVGGILANGGLKPKRRQPSKHYRRHNNRHHKSGGGSRQPYKGRRRPHSNQRKDNGTSQK